MLNEQAVQLRKLSSYHFMLVELTLFLDTHPDNTEALKMFEDYKEKYKVMLKNYEQKYGPITTMGVIGNTTWDWIKSPWPWENAKEMVN